jgi:hypothetical protein
VKRHGQPGADGSDGPLPESSKVKLGIAITSLENGKWRAVAAKHEGRPRPVQCLVRGSVRGRVSRGDRAWETQDS